jgi:glycosyltransferase involved in cell wall biosynthesis
MQPESLRIAFATPQYVTEERFDGGLAHYVYRVARALAGLGHDIHVITASEADDARIEHDGVTVHRVRASRIWPQIDRLTCHRFTSTSYQLDLSVQVYRKLKQLNRKPFDLVQVPSASYCGLVSTALLRVPHVLRASSYRPVCDSLNGVTRRIDSRSIVQLERLQYRITPHVYAPSHTLQRTLAEDAKVEGVRVIRTPIYLETGKWDASIYDDNLKDKKYLLFFGRFSQLKGFHILAQAVPRLLEIYPDAHVAFVGRDMKSPFAASMANYARTLCVKAAERVTFIEALPHSQLYPVIANAHLVVLPSLMENFPNSCLEAMALGRPVIGTRGASFEELITDEETGFLVAPNEVGILSDRIISAWSHPSLTEIGEAARLKSLEFAPERTVTQLLNYYREVLSSVNSSAPH